MASLAQESTKAGAWALLQNSARRLLSTLVFIVLARFFLDDEAFGLAAMTSLVIETLNVLVRQGLGAAIIQRPQLLPGHLDAAFWVNVISGAILAALALVGADALGLLLREPRIAPLLRVHSISLILTSVALTQEAILTRELKFEKLAKRTFLAATCGGLVGLVMAASGGGVWSIIAMQIATSFSSVVLLWKSSPWRPTFGLEWARLKELLPTSLGIAAYATIRNLSSQLDQFLLGVLVGVAGLGVYDVAQRIVRLFLSIFVQAIENVAFPSFARLQDDDTRICKALERAMRLSSGISFPLFSGLAVTAQYFVIIVYGEKWVEAATVIPMLAVGACIMSIDIFGCTVLNAIGRSTTVIGVFAIGAVVMIIAGYSLGRSGPAGMATAFAIRLAITLPIWIAALNRHVGFKISSFGRAISGNLAACAVMVLVASMVKGVVADLGDLPALLLCILAGTIAYLAGLWLVARKTLEDFFQVWVHLRSA